MILPSSAAVLCYLCKTGAHYPAEFFSQTASALAHSSAARLYTATGAAFSG